MHDDGADLDGDALSVEAGGFDLLDDGESMTGEHRADIGEHGGEVGVAVPVAAGVGRLSLVDVDQFPAGGDERRSELRCQDVVRQSMRPLCGYIRGAPQWIADSPLRPATG